MPDTPPRLLGNYRTPVFDYGSTAFCEVRGECEIVGLSSGPIPWPIGRRGQQPRTRFLILYSGLVEAVKREAVSTVAYWWGVSPQTVTTWRKALGVAGTMNEGTLDRRREGHTEILARARQKAVAKARDLGRRVKISLALHGRSKPPDVARAVGKARLGSKHSEAAKKRMSESQKARGSAGKPHPPWTPEEDELVSSLPPIDAAAKDRKEREGRLVEADEPSGQPGGWMRGSGWGISACGGRSRDPHRFSAVRLAAVHVVGGSLEWATGSFFHCHAQADGSADASKHCEEESIFRGIGPTWLQFGTTRHLLQHATKRR